MKKILVAILLMSLLSGCKAPEPFETMTDLYYTPETPQPAKISVWLPENTVSEVLKNEDSGTIYLCDGYSVALQTMAAGDLDATLQAVTGYSADSLRGISWKQGTLGRYECAWASAGESGEQISRTVVLDDGTHHYAVTVTGPAPEAAAMAATWKTIMDSVALDTAPSPQDTASDTLP